MTPEQIHKRIEVLDMIVTDAERDIKEADGKPFTGRNIVEFNTMIAALAKMLKEVLSGTIPAAK